jgi:hypothetical protein
VITLPAPPAGIAVTEATTLELHRGPLVGRTYPTQWLRHIWITRADTSAIVATGRVGMLDGLTSWHIDGWTGAPDGFPWPWMAWSEWDAPFGAELYAAPLDYVARTLPRTGWPSAIPTIDDDGRPPWHPIDRPSGQIG